MTINEQTLTVTLTDAQWAQYVASVTPIVKSLDTRIADYFQSYGFVVVSRLWAAGAIITLAYAVEHLVISAIVR